mgnify:CR=1 FL=1
MFVLPSKEFFKDFVQFKCDCDIKKKQKINVVIYIAPYLTLTI